VDYLKSEESILRAYLMANYSADVRPVVNVSTVTYVNITLTIIQIMDLVIIILIHFLHKVKFDRKWRKNSNYITIIKDEQNQVMITNAQIALVLLISYTNLPYILVNM
jgi:hypothetical protein